MNKFEEMWNELKKSVKDKLDYHKSGIMQSLAESIHGETECEQFIHMMEEIESKYNI